MLSWKLQFLLNFLDLLFIVKHRMQYCMLKFLSRKLSITWRYKIALKAQKCNNSSFQFYFLKTPKLKVQFNAEETFYFDRQFFLAQQSFESIEPVRSTFNNLIISHLSTRNEKFYTCCDEPYLDISKCERHFLLSLSLIKFTDDVFSSDLFSPMCTNIPCRQTAFNITMRRKTLFYTGECSGCWVELPQGESRLRRRIATTGDHKWR